MPYERLAPTNPFSGVTPGSTLLVEQVHLPVTFSTRKKYDMEFINFELDHIRVSYNAILGYPVPSKFMVATHNAYDFIKMPGSNGTLTIRCDEKDTTYALLRPYKVAATIS